MANPRFTQFYYTKHNYPVQLDCNFVVDSTNGNGLGIRSLKGAGISAVYMKTSATPAATNPVVEAGIILVQFQDNYNGYYFGTGGFVSPVTGSNINLSGSSVLTVGQPYVITALGTSTTANWVAAGVPIGTTPAVGVAFFAAITGGGTGTGTVKAAGVAGVGHIEVIGNPNLTIVSTGPKTLGGGSGAYMVMQCIGATDASTTTPIPKAPADGSVVGLSFVFSNSRILVQGS